MSHSGPASATGSRRRVRLGHLAIDALTEAQTLDHVTEALNSGRGGIIVTPNVDIWMRTRGDPDLRRLVAACDLAVADGMPLVWSARLAGTPIPQRVTGAGLVERLVARAAREGWSVFVLGGGSAQTSSRAAEVFAAKYPDLRLVGAVTPPFGFEQDPLELDRLVDVVAASRADVVLIGLGFPKQERLAARLFERMPGSWFLGCGAGVQMAAGMTRRAPDWVQSFGVEWVFRLVQEPRRLARRYLVDDLPAALALVSGALLARWSRR